MRIRFTLAALTFLTAAVSWIPVAGQPAEPPATRDDVAVDATIFDGKVVYRR